MTSMPMLPGLGGSIFTDLIGAATNFLTTKEKEETKRAEIAAQLEASLTICNEYFKRHDSLMNARKEEIDRAYSYVDKIMKSQLAMENEGLMRSILEFVNSVHAKNMDSYDQAGDALAKGMQGLPTLKGLRND